MKYFSMFSGIGGFERGIQARIPDAACVGFSEIDKYAIAIYQHHYPEHKNYGDAFKIDPETIPDFDLLVGGFPCQAFSVAGKRGGFQDTRGTLFFEIARILAHKRPRHFLLENVKGLLSHDNGKTFQTILGVLSDLGYGVEWQVLNSKDFGVPQNRERVFIVGHLGGTGAGKVFPIEPCNSKNNQGPEDIANCLDANYFKGPSAGFGGKGRTMVGTFRTHKDGQGFRKVTSGMSQAIPARAREDGRRFKENGDENTVRVGTLRTHKDGEGFREIDSGISPTIPARAREDGSGQPVIAIPVLPPDRLEKRQNGRRFKEEGDPAFTCTAQDRHGVFDGARIRRLTPTECERLQAFPDGWTRYGKFGDGVKEISDSQRYKTLGNSVTTSVISAVVERVGEHPIEK